MNIIAAVDENWGIGKDGDLLFHIKQDMEFFKDTTMGNIVVMGRKTLDSFPGGRPLKNRVNIVITRDKSFNRDGAVVCHSEAELLGEIKKYDTEKVFVIGGEQIYKLLLPYCDRAYITKIDASRDADAYMQDLDCDKCWTVERQSKDFIGNGITYRFCVYKRV